MESVRSGGGSGRAIGLGSGSGEAVADYSSEVDALAQGRGMQRGIRLQLRHSEMSQFLEIVNVT